MWLPVSRVFASKSAAKTHYKHISQELQRRAVLGHECIVIEGDQEAYTMEDIESTKRPEGVILRQMPLS